VDEVAFGRYRLIAAIVVVIGAILVAAGIAGYLLQPHPPASQTPTVLPAQPSGPTVQSAPASAPTAQPSAAADVPGLAPFVGSWHAHEEGLDIQPNGHGRETYSDRSTCPDAPMAGCGITGTVDFTLSAVSGDTATGAVTAASNSKTRWAGRSASPWSAAVRGFSYQWREGSRASRSATATTTSTPVTTTAVPEMIAGQCGA
jgi:hypothetical protein